MKITRAALVAALGAIAWASVASAGVNSWTLTGPGGGELTAVSIQPGNSPVMLASGGNGMYRSVDGGATWTYAGDAIGMASIVWDPTHSSRVFAAGGGLLGIYRSDDGGATFAATPGPANASPHRLAIGTDGLMYLADRKGHIYKSANAGQTWAEVGHAWNFDDDVLGAIAVDPTNSSVLLATINGDGTYRSTDGGASWSAPAAGSPGSPSQNYAQLYRLVFKPGDSHRVLGVSTLGLYFSDDGGVSWSHPVAGIWFDVAFDAAATNDVVGVSLDGQIERSTDGGATWPTAARGPLLHVLNSRVVNVAPGGTVLLATSDGPMISTDGGAHFRLAAKGIQAESAHAFATANDGTIYASLQPGPFGVYRRLAGQWGAAGNDLLRSRIPLYAGIQNLGVAPENSLNIFAVGPSDYLMMSYDGGVNWTAAHPAFANLGMIILKVVVDPSDEHTVYVLTMTTGLWKSTTGGITFVNVSAPLPNGDGALAVDPSNSQILYSGDWNGVVFKSVDGGTSWNPAGTAPGGSVIDFQFDSSDANLMYVTTQGAVAKSIDGGATWAALDFGGQPNPWAPHLMIDPAMPKTLIVGNTPTNGNGFMRSVDGGAHWQKTTWQQVHTTFGGLDNYAFERSSGTVIAGGIGTGVNEYLIGTDLKIESNDFPVAVSPNSSGTMTIAIKNLGPFDAAAPDFWLNVPGKISVTPPANCTFTAPNLHCTLPNILHGDTLNYQIAYSTGSTLGTGAFSESVLPREYELTPDNNAKATAVVVSNISDLELTSTATPAAITNGQLTLTATIRNKGPDSSATTSYSLTPPLGVSTVVATPSAGSCIADQNGKFTCALGALAKDATATVTVTATAAAAGTQTWSGSVVGGSLDLDSSNNSVSSDSVVTTPPPPPPLADGNGGNGNKSGGGGGGLDTLLLGWLGLAVTLQLRRTSRRWAA